MNEKLQSIIDLLMGSGERDGPISFFDYLDDFKIPAEDESDIAQALNRAFLHILSGNKRSGDARDFLLRMTANTAWQDVAHFYLNGIELIHRELAKISQQNPDFSNRLNGLSDWASIQENLKQTPDTAEKFWKVFFPEGEGIRGHEKGRIKSLRAKRHVAITDLNPYPVTDPAQQILFTSNVLLTVPFPSKSQEDLILSESIKAKLDQIKLEPQLYWYDHPIP